MDLRTVMRRLRTPFLFLLGGVLGVVALVSLTQGAVDIPVADTLAILRAHLPGGGEATLGPEAAAHESVLWHLRLPRLLFGIIVGAALSVSGALMQGLFRNPLADPGLIGVSSGAALGAVTIIILGGHFFPGVSWLSDIRFLPAAAFVGAFLVTIAIQRIASSGGYTAVATLLLAGVAMNSIVGALIGLATFLATDVQLRTLSFWTLGSLGGATWETLGLALPFCIGLLIIAPFFASALNAMSLGEAEAEHLGFSVERTKRVLIVITAAGVGVCVAFTGMIGFIGLVVPHLIRLCIGPDHRWLIPGSALGGALLLVMADTTARTIVAPAEMPIGILTAAFGGPFFLFMLLSQRRRALWG